MRLFSIILLFLVTSSCQNTKDSSVKNAKEFLNKYPGLDSSFVNEIKLFKQNNGLIALRFKNSLELLSISYKNYGEKFQIIKIPYDSLDKHNTKFIEIVRFFKIYTDSDINRIAIDGNYNVEIGLDGIEGTLLFARDSLTVISDVIGVITIESILNNKNGSAEWAEKLNDNWYLYKVQGSF